MRKPRRRDSWPASTPRLRAAASRLILRRDEAYIGVLIDDLVTQAPTSRTGCTPRAPNIACCCGTTTPTCGSPNTRIGSG